MSINKYFFINYTVDKEDFTDGPYSSLEEAVALLLTAIPLKAKSKAKKKFYTYKADIHECIRQENGSWKTISKPIEERKCRKQKRI